MGCINKMAKAIAIWIASLLQVAFAIWIMYLLFNDLYQVDPPDITNQSNVLNAANETAASNSTNTFAPSLVSPLFNSSEYKQTCYLSEEGNKESACVRTIYVLAITWAACLALSIIQCFTCNCCGCGSIFDTILSVCLCGLWAWFAIALTKDHTAINDQNPQPAWNVGDVKDARSTVLYLSWAEVALFAFTALMGLSGMCPDRGRDSYKA